MKTLRPPALATLLVLVLAAAAVAAEPYAARMKEAGEALTARRPPPPERFALLRVALAAVPRNGLSDDEWLDLHLVLAALDRRLDPSPPPAPPAARELPLPPADWPPPGAVTPDGDPGVLLDVAAAARDYRPPPGPAPFAEARPPLLKAAARVRAFADAAGALGTGDPVLAAAAAAAATEARDLAFDLSRAGAGAGACGRERFEWILRRDHGLSFDADRVREIGEAARLSILAELEATAAAVDPSRTWRELTEISRADHPGSTEELLESVRFATGRAMRIAIDSGLVTVPESARHPANTLLRVINPQFPTPFACYGAEGPEDGIYRGNFVVTGLPPDLPERERKSWLRGRDVHWMGLVSGHEAVPGHHLQYSRASELRSPWRYLGHTSIYVEGWGLYSEDLMDRAGAFADPFDRLALLRMRLWRAVRVLVDVGLHTGTLRPSEAVHRLTDEVLMDRWSAEREVERYLVSPTQPLSYLIGWTKIRAIRQAWLAERGAAAEREFNDRLLGLGPVPLDLAAALLLGKRAAYDASHP